MPPEENHYTDGKLVVMEEKKNNVICIIGMHRSGTSMVARILNLCGLDLGPSEQFIEPNESNPLGYFENVNFTYKIDEALLAHFGGSWDNPPLFKEGWEHDPSLEQIVNEAKSLLQTFSNNSQWGWKDPRATILLPFWKLLIPDLGFVICVRSPLEIAKSLASRDGLPIHKGVYLWNQYMRAAIRDTEGFPRIFSFYEDFFKDASGEIKRVVEFCGLQVPDDLSSLYDVISPELKHHTSETLELLNEDQVITEYKLFYIVLRALSTEGFVQSTSDRAREALASENISKFFKLLEQFHDEQAMAQLQSALADKEQQITRLYAMVHQQQQAHSKKEEQVAQLIAQQGILNQVLKDLRAALNQKDEQVGQLQTTVQDQQQVLGEKEQQLARLSEEREQLVQEVSRLQATALAQKQVLDIVHASLGWKLLNRYWQLENKLLAPGTRRRKAYDLILMGIKHGSNRTKDGSIIVPFHRIRDSFLPLGTKMKKIARLIYNLPSLLTQRTLGRIVRYIRLFGLTATYEKIKMTLWSEGAYVFLNDRAVNISPVINIEFPREGVVPNEDATISVLIPVKNSGDDFRCLLSMMKNQKGFKEIEIIVVDSGSTDKTLEIAMEFGAKIIEILPEDFSHSYARNLAAEHASGDYLLFTVQDALPPSDLWLHELFSVIKNNDVVAVSCAEYPREDADLFYRATSWNHYKFLEVNKRDRIMCKPDDENYLTLRKNGQLSDIACLIPRDVFIKYKFRGNFAEDLDLGIRLIRDGYRLAFLGSTRIIHSHNRPAYYHLRRAYVDFLSLLRILPGYTVGAIEAERLFRDIIFTYEVVNSTIQEELQRVTVPCKVTELSNIVTKKFWTAAKSNYTPYISGVSNVFIDNKFTSFLQCVSKQNYISGDRTSSYDGILLYAVLEFTSMIFEYMNDAYELIDDHVLEDFKSCLYKAYAFQCGVHLAYCFFRVSESTKEKLKKINDELKKEV